MTAAVRLSAPALNGGDGATAKITQRLDLRQEAVALLFEGDERIGQEAPPIRTYTYVRIVAPKKESRHSPAYQEYEPGAGNSLLEPAS